MRAFSTKPVDYQENRADGGFAWRVRFDLASQNGDVITTLRVKLTGADPGDSRAVWLAGTREIWNNKVVFDDGVRLYESKLNFSFVTSGEHRSVRVHAGTGHFDLDNWYVDSDFPPGFDDENAAHEVGHMLGNFDEYVGGATRNGFINTGTLMSDLTVNGFEDYFFAVEQNAEVFGGGTLSTVLAMTGDANPNVLTGGAGRDIFDFDSIKETGITAATRDVITDFLHLRDRLDLSGIDASSLLGGNNTFTFRGTAAFTQDKGGELRFQKFDMAGTANDFTLVYGDTDADRGAELHIRLDGLVTLTAADFIV
ncbi:MAG: hypothetical protein K2Y51_06770 [Gammaproteobacteria bacterium]|nr:hypothetical protein [Gammaproteobacteria bacterium]